MKKLVFLMLLGCIGMQKPIHAANTDISTLDNVIYIEPFSAKPGTAEMSVSIKMKNSAPIRGFQFDLTLPAGVTPATYANSTVKCSLSNGRLPEGDQHTLTVEQQANGCYRFLCGSLQNEVFTGTDGEIATLKVNISAEMAEGNYPVLLTDMKLTETDISNSYETERIETTLTISNDVRTVLDETSTTVPTASNGAVDVRVVRTINANEWSTICLPFAMTETQVAAAFGSDVKLADFISYDTVEDNAENVVGLNVNFNMVTAIEANHPYLIKVSSAITEFTADGVTIAPEDEPCKIYDNGKTGTKRVIYGTFTGTYVADYEIPYSGEDVSLFLSGNKIYYATAATMHMKAFRACFWFSDILPTANAARISMSFDETTGISENENGKMINDEYYNLQGQRVTAPAKGMYIHNGKVIIKK